MYVNYIVYWRQNVSRALKKGTENRQEERKNTVVFREREIKRTLYDPSLSYNIPNVFTLENIINENLHFKQTLIVSEKTSFYTNIKRLLYIG